MTLFSLENQVAFVTGAGSGIGQRIAIGLAEAGADVACVDLRAEGLEETVARISQLGRRATYVVADVTDEDAIAHALGTSEDRLGGIDVAANCAGIANAAPAEELSRQQWQRMIDVNMTGIFLCAQAEGRSMLKRGRGSIINIASMSASIINRGILQTHYYAAKAGVVHLSKSMAMEWSRRGVRVNCISPGYTATPMNMRPEMADKWAEYEESTPMGRMASTDELVGPAVFLASAASSFVTGIDLLVDGGFVCW